MLGRAMTPSDDTEPSEVQHEGERIAKVIARAGLASRREAEAWIEAGRVAVNGQAIKSAALNVGPRDKVAIDGKPLPARERTRLWLYHKPRGLVTTARDPQGRTTVFDVLPPELPRVVSVGRLDLTTEGLLLLTNDGGLARVLAHPSTAWLRRYRVRAFGQVDLARLEALRNGIEIDGFAYGPIEAVLDRQQGDNAWLSLGLREGKNREVRRVLEHLGLNVNRLIRLSFGPFQLGDLGEGAVEEIRTRYLKDQLGSLAEKAECDFEAPMVDRTPDPVKKVMRARAAPEAPRHKMGLTTDRKGRQVLVERFGEKPAIKPRKPRPPREGREREERPPQGRGSFGKPERTAPGRGDFRPRDDRPPRRPDRPPRPDGTVPRPFRVNEEKGTRVERGKRGERPERPQEPRPYGNRTRAFKAKPERSTRPPRADRSGEGTQDRGERRAPPREDRQRERSERPDTGARTARPPRRDGESPRKFSKAGGPPGRPAGSRPAGPRPSGAGASRPGAGGRPDTRPSGGRPPSGKPAGRPGGGKPGGRPSGGKPGGRPGGGRPGGGRPGGGKPGGGKPGQPRR